MNKLKIIGKIFTFLVDPLEEWKLTHKRTKPKKRPPTKRSISDEELPPPPKPSQLC
jgi:hypothetical protein